MKPLALALAAMLSLEGCISPYGDSVGRYTSPIGGAPVISNETPYSAALRCMSGITRTRPIKFAVGQISDYTGKTESDGSGRKVTAGAALMAMTALAKAGVPLVERFDTSVAEMDLKYANNKLIADDQPKAPGDYRKILSGSVLGSDYYVVGGITELNFNIRSENATGDGGGTGTGATKGTFGGSLYVMNIGLDLRLVNSITLEVVDVVSYQKQIIGRQVSAGIFDFLGTNFFDASVGESALEPIQLGVRSVIERGMLEMISRAYGAPSGACAVSVDYLGGNPYQQQAMAYQRPYAQAYQQPYAPVGAQFGAGAYAYQQPYNYQQPYRPTEMTNANAFNRSNPYRGYSSDDPLSDGGLRPGY
jgi:curli production assembly/transport component CsgG/holdfast attachment protein HfaB